MQPLRIQADFVHTDQADRGEVVVECAEVSLRVRIESCVEELRDNGSLCLQGSSGDIHQAVKSCEEISLVCCQVCDTRQVDGYNTDRTCRFTGSEESAGLFSELTKVES